MSEAWPTMPADCMGVSVFTPPDYPGVLAYCTEKGCIPARAMATGEDVRHTLEGL